MENKQLEFADANAAPDPPRPINNNNRAMFNLDAQPTRRTIGDSGAPIAFFANRSTICPPPVNRNDYEIKSSIINLVKQYQFHGLPNEHRWTTLTRWRRSAALPDQTEYHQTSSNASCFHSRYQIRRIADSNNYHPTHLQRGTNAKLLS